MHVNVIRNIFVVPKRIGNILCVHGTYMDIVELVRDREYFVCNTNLIYKGWMFKLNSLMVV